MFAVTTQSAEHYASECYKALKPLVWVLIPCGLDLRYELQIHGKNVKPKYYQIFLNILAVIFVCTCLTFAGIMFYKLIFLKKAIYYVCFAVTAVCFTTGVVILRIILIFKSDKFQCIFSTLNSYCTVIAGDVQDKFSPVYKLVGRFINISFVLISLLLILCVVTNVRRDTCNENTSEVHQNNSSIQSVFTTSSPIKTLLMALLEAGSVVVVIYRMFFALLYYSLCLIVLKLLEHLQEYLIMTKERPLIGHIAFEWHPILDFIKGHQMICDAIKQLDHIFRQGVAIWELLESVALIFSVRSLNVDKPQHYRAIELELLALDCIVIVTFTLKTLLVSHINEQVYLLRFD